MFTAGLAETVQDVVTLNGVEPGMISGLLDYAYTGQITITKHNVQSMLSAANLLEILPVRDACCQVRLSSHVARSVSNIQISPVKGAKQKM